MFSVMNSSKRPVFQAIKRGALGGVFAQRDSLVPLGARSAVYFGKVHIKDNAKATVVKPDGTRVELSEPGVYDINPDSNDSTQPMCEVKPVADEDLYQRDRIISAIAKKDMVALARAERALEGKQLPAIDDLVTAALFRGLKPKTTPFKEHATTSVSELLRAGDDPIDDNGPDNH